MELVPRNILYSREELPIYHVKASEITGLNGAEHESVFLLETVVSSFFWGDVSFLKIVGFLPAAFHLVSVWIWRETDRRIPVFPSGILLPFSAQFPVISGHFTGTLRKMHWIRPFPTVNI
jgi:hypothetical protein